MQGEIALCGMITISGVHMAPRGGQCDVASLVLDVNTTACGCVIRSLSPASNATGMVSAAVDVGYLRLPEDPRDLYTYLGGAIGVVPLSLPAAATAWCAQVHAGAQMWLRSVQVGACNAGVCWRSQILLLYVLIIAVPYSASTATAPQVQRAFQFKSLELGQEVLRRKTRISPNRGQQAAAL